MRLGTKLTLYLSLIIIVVLAGYGYLNILSRREILLSRMKTEVRSTTQALKVSLEAIQLPEEMKYIQGMIDAVSENGKTLDVVVYYPEENLIFHSQSLERDIEPYLGSIKRSVREDRPQEELDTYQKVPLFSYTLPFKERTGHIGGVSILRHTSLMEKEIEKSKWSIVVTIFVLICGTLVLILLGTRKWVTHPISKLMDGINHLSKGDLGHQIDLRRRDELSQLAQAFNQMAVDLRIARERILQEAETKLELERSLRQSEKLATIGQLASELAHEIGTPLNIIHGRAELIQKRLGENAEIHKYLDIILHQTERITKIIQQLLGLVRKKKPEWKALNIGIILENTLDLLDQQIQKQSVRVVKDVTDNLPLVNGNPDQLQQVFLNLILNAIQSMPEGGRLCLSASMKRISREGFEEDRRQYAEVCVEDTGVGMEKEVIQQIFDPFFTTKETGTGLGLMVTQGIVQDHEGWIEVKSEVGKGSVFKVYLPSAQGEMKDDEEKV
ncbi:MAG TPA: ATP-binding protein [Thermodesulfobacteriota bacterium]|nr:ATP-binding protein [Thermodesulfobacteriota bacterium]